MGGDDSQKLLPWRGIYSSPGRKPPAHYEINTVTETAPRFARLPAGVAQLQTTWVILGKHRWVTSAACRSSQCRNGSRSIHPVLIDRFGGPWIRLSLTSGRRHTDKPG